MIYLRNDTKHEQWLEDPSTGIKIRVEAESLARVTPELANYALRLEPAKWVVVTPIAPPPP